MTSLIESINQAAGVNTGIKNTKDSTEDIMGKEDFLTLLVAQLKNQDPLNPDEPTEFTAQLAQFSSLEQLYNINDSMNSLISSNAHSDRLSTLSTIGKDVAYFGNSFQLSTEPVTLGYQLDGTATEVTLTVQQNGIVYATLDGTELSSGNHFLSWDGLKPDGTTATPGEYQLVISAKAASGESVAAAPLIRAEVTGVDLNGEKGGILITDNGEINFDDILGIYEAGAGIPADTGQVDQASPLDPLVDTVNDAEEVVDTTSNLVNTIEQM